MTPVKTGSKQVQGPSTRCKRGNGVPAPVKDPSAGLSTPYNLTRAFDPNVLSWESLSCILLLSLLCSSSTESRRVQERVREPERAQDWRKSDRVIASQRSAETEAPKKAVCFIRSCNSLQQVQHYRGGLGTSQTTQFNGVSDFARSEPFDRPNYPLRRADGQTGARPRQPPRFPNFKYFLPISVEREPTGTGGHSLGTSLPAG